MVFADSVLCWLAHLGDVGDDGRERRELVVHLLPPLPLRNDVLGRAPGRSPPAAFRLHRCRRWCGESPGSCTGVVSFLLGLSRREAQLL